MFISSEKISIVEILYRYTYIHKIDREDGLNSIIFKLRNSRGSNFKSHHSRPKEQKQPNFNIFINTKKKKTVHSILKIFSKRPSNCSTDFIFWVQHFLYFACRVFKHIFRVTTTITEKEGSPLPDKLFRHIETVENIIFTQNKNI